MSNVLFGSAASPPNNTGNAYCYFASVVRSGVIQHCTVRDHFLSISGDLLADISRSPSQHTWVWRL